MSFPFGELNNDPRARCDVCLNTFISLSLNHKEFTKPTLIGNCTDFYPWFKPGFKPVEKHLHLLKRLG